MNISRSAVIVIVVILSLVLVSVFGTWALISYNLLPGPHPVESNPIEDATITPSFFPAPETKPAPSLPTTPPNPPSPTTTSSAVPLTPPSKSNLIQSFNKISDEPVVGAFAVGTASSSRVLYVRRSDGHLFSVASNLGSTVVSNTTIAKTYQVRGGQPTTTQTIFAFQTVDRSNSQWFLAPFTFFASSSAATWTSDRAGDDEVVLGSIATTPFSSAVRDVLPAPDEKKIALVETSGGGTVIRVSDWSAQGEVVLSLPFKELTVSWPATTTLTLQTKPANNAPGLLYAYDLKTKHLTLLINNVIGLSALLSPSGRFIAYSGINQGLVFSALYDRQTKTITRLPFTTLLEKCVWGEVGEVLYCGVPSEFPSGQYPDDWYQGQVATTDTVWQFNPLNGENKLLYDPKADNLGQTIDSSNLFTNKTGTTLYLINKNDLSLWSLALGPVFGQ